MMKYLLVGLGNPGPEYEETRHNLGFQILDYIAQYYKFPDFRPKGQGLFSQGQIDDHNVMLYKPTTFMNLSGKALIPLKQFYKILNKCIYVFHDELDLLPGQIKIKRGGGHGGHNGLKSIDAAIGNDYWRIRLGIGHPGDRTLVSNFVLGKIPIQEAREIQNLYEPIAEYIGELFGDNPPKYMNDIKRKLNGV